MVFEEELEVTASRWFIVSHLWKNSLTPQVFVPGFHAIPAETQVAHLAVLARVVPASLALTLHLLREGAWPVHFGFWDLFWLSNEELKQLLDQTDSKSQLVNLLLLLGLPPDEAVGREGLDEVMKVRLVL